MSPTAAVGGPTAGDPPRSHAEALCFVIFVGAVLSSLFVLVHPWYDLTNDGSTYIVTARALAAGDGYTYLGSLFRMRPPGFAALLSLFLVQGPAGFVVLNALVAAFGALGVVLLYLHQRPRVGWVLALATSAAVWLNPGYRRLSNQVMSDVPGLALVLLALLLARWAGRRPSVARELLLGACIGCAAWVRSIAILLVPAIVAARLCAVRRDAPAAAAWPRFALERLVLFAATAWLLVLPWQIVRGRDAPPPPADQTLNYSISTALWHQDPGDPRSPLLGPGRILARAPARLHELALVAGSRMRLRIPGSPPPTPAAQAGYLAVALLLGGACLVVLARRRAAAEWFAAATAGVISLYFVFTDRLALPLFVFGLAAAVELLRAGAGRLAGPRAATVVPTVALVLLVAADFRPRDRWPEIAARHRAFVETAEAVREALAPDARLGAAQGFHHSVYLERPVYSLLYAVQRGGRPEAAEEIIDRYGLNTIVLSTLVPPDVELIPYFRNRYGPGTPAGSALVWRVRDGPPAAG